MSLLNLGGDSAFWVCSRSIPLADNDHYFGEFVFPEFFNKPGYELSKSQSSLCIVGW